MHLGYNPSDGTWCVYNNSGYFICSWKESESKMTTLIEYHHKTKEMALFESDGNYWIGSYSPQLTHQNGEPLYCLVKGYFKTAEEGLQEMSAMTGDEC